MQVRLTRHNSQIWSYVVGLGLILVLGVLSREGYKVRMVGTKMPHQVHVGQTLTHTHSPQWDAHCACALCFNGRDQCLPVCVLGHLCVCVGGCLCICVVSCAGDAMLDLFYVYASYASQTVVSSLARGHV